MAASDAGEYLKSKKICEELECDWSTGRAEYASVNRHFRENKVYRRMTTNASGAVRISSEYLQQAGASARERLMATVTEVWAVPRSARHRRSLWSSGLFLCSVGGATLEILKTYIDLFAHSLGNDLAIERVRVVWREIEKIERMMRRIGQYAKVQILKRAVRVCGGKS